MTMTKYDIVPNKPDHITAQEVVGKLRATGVQTALSTASGILSDLQSCYWRAPIAVRERREAEDEASPKPDAPAAPLDSFAGIAARLRTVGRELSTLADEIETAALATEQARESAAQDGERLRQLRQLLMGSR